MITWNWLSGTAAVISAALAGVSAAAAQSPKWDHCANLTADTARVVRACTTYLNRDKSGKDKAKSIMAYHNRGAARLIDKEEQKAISDFSRAIALRPLAQTHYLRGLSYSRTDVYDRAIEDFTEAIRIKPDYAEAYFERHTACYMHKTHQSCDKGDWDKALALDGNVVNRKFENMIVDQKFRYTGD